MAETFLRGALTAASAFGIVLSCMLLLTLALFLLRGLAAWTARRAAQAPAPVEAATSGPPEELELDPETLAVISAAAFEVLQRPVRIHRVHLHREPERDRWSRAGRMDILVSHTLGRNT